jgi:Protein of unknown function (DUF1580)
MIDTLTENVLSLADAAKTLPARRGGKRPHVSCLYRWAQHGCRGIRLETLQCGGTKITSLEALQRFFERLGAASSGEIPPTRSARQREQAILRAERELDRQGV